MRNNAFYPCTKSLLSLHLRIVPTWTWTVNGKNFGTFPLHYSKTAVFTFGSQNGTSVPIYQKIQHLQLDCWIWKPEKEINIFWHRTSRHLQDSSRLWSKLKYRRVGSMITHVYSQPHRKNNSFQCRDIERLYGQVQITWESYIKIS